MTFQEVVSVLERQLELEGGLTVCRLGTLRPESGQTLECLLRLEGVQPGRRVAVSVDAVEGDITRGTRIFAVPAHHGLEAVDVVLRGIRFYLPQEVPARLLRVRADAHYLEQGERCIL